MEQQAKKIAQLQMNNMGFIKQEKARMKDEALNVNFKGKNEKIPVNEVLKAKSKVPIAAQFINDDEHLKETLMKLQEEYKLLLEDNKKAIDVVYDMEVKAQKTAAVLDKEKDAKKVEIKDG